MTDPRCRFTPRDEWDSAWLRGIRVIDAPELTNTDREWLNEHLELAASRDRYRTSKRGIS